MAFSTRGSGAQSRQRSQNWSKSAFPQKKTQPARILDLFVG
jgi:hypothetical protein